MTKIKRAYAPRVPRGRGFTLEQRRRHLACQVAPYDEAKQSLVRSLPLFDVALRGRDAVEGRGVRR